MDIPQHLLFCPPGGLFFDAPTNVSPDDGAFSQVHEEVPPGWERSGDTEWIGLNPPGVALPQQGWKIHVSATLENAQRILATTWKYCIAGGITFKFIRSLPVLEHRNSKYGDRSASGKFITLYPLDEAHFEQVLRELGGLLDGEEGPYILSDLRWRSGPLYVRYGGFIPRITRMPSGESVHCLEDPEGRLVPDHRGPGFRPPEWVTMPSCLTEAMEARNAGTLDDFPYRVTSALHFSNGGGVYLGTDTHTDTSVLLREARPFAGLVEGRDAVYRQQREHAALRRLAGLDCIPRLVEYRKGREHYFLVREYIEGKPLDREMMRRNPLMRGSRSADEYAEYTAWAMAILDHIERGVAGMHERDIVFGDLHPSNILVRPDGTVGFIDFETAVPPEEATHQTMGATGFTAPGDRTGRDIDQYALGCLRLAVFIPLTAALSWGPQKAVDLIDAVTAHFPVPTDYADQVLADLRLTSPHAQSAPETSASPAEPTDWPAADRAAWPALRTEIGEGVLACATPEREDRLFPGDPEQFRIPEGGVNFAHGAAGVLWCLAEADVPVPDGHIEWLTAAARRLDRPRPGFYDGMSGIAYALDRLGRSDAAREHLDQWVGPDLQDINDSLLTGRSGIGLAALHFARRTGDRDHLDRALQIADQITGRAEPSEDTKPRFGLLRGTAGNALFLLRLYEETQDSALLEHARTALHTDLARLGWSPDARLPEDAPGGRPLLGAGCAGTGMVLHDFLGHARDPELERARDAIRTLSEQHFIAQSGLFQGRGGTVLALRHMGGAEGEGSAPLHRHIRDCALQTVQYEGRPAFLGQDSLRISADLATGGPGVLLALQTAHGDGGAALPFFRRPDGATA